MKVVREKTIFDKIVEAVEQEYPNIVRIELTNKEFADLLWEVGKEGSVASSEVEMKGVPTRVINENLGFSEGKWSGCYVVYKGICIQTHESYTV